MYLVLFLFCLLSVLRSPSPALSSFPPAETHDSKDVSNSPSPELESDRCAASAVGAAEEERGGGKVASLIVMDIHNMPIPKYGISIGEEYRERIRVISWSCRTN
jgi:hypothetical protein